MYGYDNFLILTDFFTHRTVTATIHHVGLSQPPIPPPLPPTTTKVHHKSVPIPPQRVHKPYQLGTPQQPPKQRKPIPGLAHIKQFQMPNSLKCPICSVTVGGDGALKQHYRIAHNIVQPVNRPRNPIPGSARFTNFAIRSQQPSARQQHRPGPYTPRFTKQKLIL